MNGLEVEIFTEKRESHSHTDVELFYVLEGTLRICIDSFDFKLSDHDVLLVNARKQHRIRSDASSLICRLKISYASLCQNMGEDAILFDCNSLVDNGVKYDELRRILQELLLDYVRKDSEGFYRTRELQDHLLDFLLKKFRIGVHGEQNKKQLSKDHRLSLILNYVSANYDKPISLSDLASHSYLSVSTLSRYFQKTMGESFVQYVKRYRVEKAAERLEQTTDSISKIAIECGFSAASVMNSAFRGQYAMTPTEYRLKNQLIVNQEEKQAQLERLRDVLDPHTGNANDSSSMRQDIRVDTGIRCEYRRWENIILNAGMAQLLDRAKLQQQLLMMTEELHVRYVRVWNITYKQMMLIDDETNRFNFSRLDSILDFFVDHGLRLFIDFGPRTDTAIVREGKALYHREEAIIFESRARWEEFLRALLQHIVKRYGEKIVSQWVFEFTFFLNEKPYYISEHYSSRGVWESGYRIVKEIIPEARVAGPGRMCMDEELIRLMIGQFLSTRYQPDIFTSFNFPYRHVSNNLDFQRILDRDFLKNQIAVIRGELEKQGYQGEYYITDWNYSLSNRSYVQDSCFRASFILKQVFENYRAVDALGCFYSSDILNSHFDADRILLGSGGLVSVDGIRKPVYYAFLFLDAMGEFLVYRGENCIVTGDRRGNFQILCHNHKELNGIFYLTAEDEFTPYDVKRLSQNRDRMDFCITLSDLQTKADYIVRQKIVNEECGSVLDQWTCMGCERELIAEDIRYLSRICVPRTEIGRAAPQGGELKLELQLAPNEIRSISVERI